MLRPKYWARADDASTVAAATGQIDGGANSPDANAWAINATPPYTFAAGDIITLEAWVKRPSIVSNYDPIISLSLNRAESGARRNFELDFSGGLLGEPAQAISFHYWNAADNAWNAFAHNAADNDTTTFHHYAFTYTFGTAGSAQLYKDGSAITGSWTSGTGNDAPYTTGIDALYLYTTNQSGEYLGGIGDEIRVSKGIARSADWVKTEYNNQNSPSTFFSISGPFQSAGSNIIARGGIKSRGGVKFR